MLQRKLSRSRHQRQGMLDSRCPSAEQFEDEDENEEEASAPPSPLWGAGPVRPVRTRMNIDRNACPEPVMYR